MKSAMTTITSRITGTSAAGLVKMFGRDPLIPAPFPDGEGPGELLSGAVTGVVVPEAGGLFRVEFTGAGVLLAGEIV